MPQDDLPRPDCNPFLLLQGRPWERPRGLLYVVLDQAELLESGLHHLVFAAVDAAWFDRLDAQEIRAAMAARAYGSIFDAMPIYLLEIDLTTRGVLKIADTTPAVLEIADQDPAGQGLAPPNLEEILEGLERRWKLFELGTGIDRAQAQLYPNLFADPDTVGVSWVEEPGDAANASLNAADPLSTQPDASVDAIKAALQGLAGKTDTDHVVVYDVGQGGANGLVSPGSSVAAYFDFGGGVTGNAKTFPSTALTQFCFGHAVDPPIILSHWDHDHWSSEGRDTRAHWRTWIVPRQAVHRTKRGFHHSSLIASITKYGTLLVWPAMTPAISVGQLTLWQCTGTSRNASGLAAEVQPPTGHSANPVLLPADAGYGDLPKAAASVFDCIACPHHGGRSRSPSVPARPIGADQRLAYSYGPGNSYKHPLAATVSAHDSAGWDDPRVGRSSFNYVRNTQDRGTSGLGHIGFNWGSGGLPKVPPCGCGCQLAVQQT